MRVVTPLKQAVVLAGGRGERLRPLTDSLPKPLVPVNGTPFLDFLLQTVADVGIQRVLLLLGYRSDVVVERYGRITSPRLTLAFSLGREDDLTGRRVLNAYDRLEDHFLLLYGDNYWPIPLSDMWARYKERDALVSTTIFRNHHGTGEYGFENNAEVSADGFVLRYDKLRVSAGLNGVDIGYFIVDKRALPTDDRANCSFEEDLLAPLIAQRQLSGYETDTQYYYVTNPVSLRAFERVVTDEKLRAIQWTRQNASD